MSRPIALLFSLVLVSILSMAAAPALAGPAAEPPSPLVPPSAGAPAAPPSSPSAPAAGLVYQSVSGVTWRTYRSDASFFYDFTYGTAYSTSGSGDLIMPVTLPNGARLTEMTYYFRDNATARDMSMGLCVVPNGGGAGACLGNIVPSTGVSATGIVSRTLTGSPILVVDNASNAYFLAATGTLSPTLGIVSARLGFVPPGAYMPVLFR